MLLSGSSQLTSLHLPNAFIGDSGAAALAQGVAKAQLNQLRELNLARNLIGDAGALALATALRMPNCRLETLHLNGNIIGSTCIFQCCGFGEAGSTFKKSILQNWNCSRSRCGAVCVDSGDRQGRGRAGGVLIR